MKKLVATLAVAGLALIPGFASARQPSEACSSGEVPPTTSPLGVGVRQSGDPYQDPTTVYACSTGQTAPGAIRVRSESSGQTTVVVDGDDANATLGCTDGYAAVRVAPDGAHLYRSGDGDYTTAARERAPQEFAGGASSDCTAS